MTNYERIKAMSVEEIAEYILLSEPSYCHFCVYLGHNHEETGYDCREGIQKWLESEVEEE